MPKKKASLSRPDDTPTTPQIEDAVSAAPAQDETPRRPRAFKGYVVAIGASAGGLEALERFFDELPADCGAAIVVIQHLSPDHKSMMDNLLARHTPMPVQMAENSMTIAANHVYLIPPGMTMTITNYHLHLIPKPPHGLSLPIDLFFNSLAKECGHRCIGVILSGTGSDGSRGAVAINDAGGFLLAQDPETAKFDGMPRSVIKTGLVDEILPPEMLARRIVAHLHNSHPLLHKTPRDTVSPPSGNPLETIFNLLYQASGVNFKEYKSTTVMRRIERRMQVRHARDLDEYLHLLENDRTEVLTLKRDILIPVTGFFRDPETFELLAQHVIDPLIDTHRETQPLRVWVAGCATGEEAYTLAMLFAEAFDRHKRWPQLKIFATDVEQSYIDNASAGLYSEGIVNELSPERLERFFTRTGTQFTVKNDIRQHIVFARHNLLEDPPFTRIHLVSCRNTLIYFDTSAQEKALLRFQYALGHNGYLLLGSSESLGNLHKDFTVLNAKHKLYRVLRPATLPLDFRGSVKYKETRQHIQQQRRERRYSREAGIIESGMAQLLKDHAPPALLISEDRELVHVYGNAQRYLCISEGSASLEISKLLVGKLAPVGIALLHKAAKENAPICSELQQVEFAHGVTETIRVSVQPLASDNGVERYFLMTFSTQTLGPSPIVPAMRDLDVVTHEHIQTLERDLATTRDSLQATIEELETANEELQATNEELMASNEELQSTNEELQSVNEELYTVNAENQEKIEILHRLNTDLDNMTRAAAIPMLFVDGHLKLTRFTREASKIFRIREGDLGRPLSDFSHELDYPELLSDLQHVIMTLHGLEREVKTWNGRWYLLRALPYNGPPRKTSGAVVTFFDITQLKDIQHLQAIVDALPARLAVLDKTGCIALVNQAWREDAAQHGDRLLSHGGTGSNYLEQCMNQHDTDESWTGQIYRGVQRVLTGELPHFALKYPRHDAAGLRWQLLHVAPIQHVAEGVIVSHSDITPWCQNQLDHD